MSLDNMVLAAIIASFFVLLGIEAMRPSQRAMPQVPGWRLIGIAGFALSLTVMTLSPLIILPWFAGVSLFDLSGWGNWAALPAIMLTSLILYWTHRIQHRFDLFWRLGGHQLHHSVARIDVASAYIFHPIDAFIQTVGSVLAAILLGLSPMAGALAGVIYFWIGMYQHLNVNTPRWTGLLIQRPEAHMFHHQYNVHARNFGDLPVWDMLFGTYHNPPRADDIRVGFEPERARRWLAMALFVDVNRGEARERI